MKLKKRKVSIMPLKYGISGRLRRRGMLLKNWLFCWRKEIWNLWPGRWLMYEINQNNFPSWSVFPSSLDNNDSYRCVRLAGEYPGCVCTLKVTNVGTDNLSLMLEYFRPEIRNCFNQIVIAMNIMDRWESIKIVFVTI